MFNLSEIVNGWKNYIVDDPTSNELALERGLHCSDCEFKTFGKMLVMFKDYSMNDIEGFYCKKCGCPLSAKLRSERSKCPINKW